MMPTPIFNSIAASDVAEYKRPEIAELILKADWASYTLPEDQADFPRLKKVIMHYPQGFRLYYIGQDPVGYTGWYPIEKDTFDRLYDNPDSLTHRGQIMPAPGSNYIYLFNCSIDSKFHHTDESRAMVKEFAASIEKAAYKGLAAVTVSPDGIRVAERFGMSKRGQMTHDGVAEDVYALRLP